MEPSHPAANITGNESIMYSRIFWANPRDQVEPHLCVGYIIIVIEHKGPSGGDSVRPPSQSDADDSNNGTTLAFRGMFTPLYSANLLQRWLFALFSRLVPICLHCLGSYLRGDCLLLLTPWHRTNHLARRGRNASCFHLHHTITKKWPETFVAT